MRDPYDIHIAFDDIVDDAPVSFHDAVQFRRFVRKALTRRPLVLPPAFRSLDHDPTAESFQPDEDVVGGVEVPPDRYPLFESFRKRFTSPAPKLFRLDVPKTYANFREARKAPYQVDLEARLDVLDAAGHVSGFDVLGEDVVRAASDLAKGGESILLPSPLRGKAECWQEDDEILLTIRFKPSKRSQILLLTTGTPVDRHVEEVVSCMGGDDLEDALPALPALSRTLASRTLLGELCRLAPKVLKVQPTSPMIGVMRPAACPDVTGAMSLLQEAQRGNMSARIETDIMSWEGHSDLLKEAAGKLAFGQRDKSRRLS